MTDKNNNGANILIGALIGGLVVGAAAVLISSNQRKLKRNIFDKVQDLKDRVGDFASNINAKAVVRDVSDKAEDWKENIEDFIENVKDQVDSLSESEVRNIKIGLVVGAALLGLAGLGTVLMSSDKEKTTSSFMSNAADWKDQVQGLLEKVNGQCLSKKKSSTPNLSNTLSNAVDFAMSGVQLWQNFTKHR